MLRRYFFGYLALQLEKPQRVLHSYLQPPHIRYISKAIPGLIKGVINRTARTLFQWFEYHNGVKNIVFCASSLFLSPQPHRLNCIHYTNEEELRLGRLGEPKIGVIRIEACWLITKMSKKVFWNLLFLK
jgi:hypothetical protein